MQAQRHHHSPALAILVAKDISFNYQGQDFFKGIRKISLQLGTGQTLAIVGKSGSGKTTLLKCIYGLEDLYSGEILMNGSKVTGPSFNLIPGHSEMALVSQDYYVLDNHTVSENISDKLIGYTDEYKAKRISVLLKLLELNFLRNTRARSLSSGQKQRVAIARALAVMPQLLLLDEPFSNLDHLLTEKLFAFINREVKKNKTSVILITHLAEEALKHADQIAVMDNGRITQQGEKWDVYYNPRNSRLAGLLGEYNLIKKEDLESGIKKIKTKSVIRPDKLKLSKTKKGDLKLHAHQCVFNGKCFEILLESKTGNTILVYHHQELKTGQEYFFEILI